MHVVCVCMCPRLSAVAGRVESYFEMRYTPVNYMPDMHLNCGKNTKTLAKFKKTKRIVCLALDTPQNHKRKMKKKKKLKELNSSEQISNYYHFFQSFSCAFRRARRRRASGIVFGQSQKLNFLFIYFVFSLFGFARAHKRTRPVSVRGRSRARLAQ